MLRDTPRQLTRSLGFTGTESGAPMNVSADQVEAGQAVYTKLTLAAYDFFVLGVSNRFLWKVSNATTRVPLQQTHHGQSPGCWRRHRLLP